jgi:hypothetical protein
MNADEHGSEVREQRSEIRGVTAKGMVLRAKGDWSGPTTGTIANDK